MYDEIQSAYNTSLAVEKGALECFHPAEEYHQEYLIKNPGGYCHLSMSTLAAARKYTAGLKELRICSDDAKKEILPKFFKTGKGQYGEGDKFIGVTVPKTRRIAKANADLSMEVVEMLLESEWHEARLCALLILLEKYKKNPETIVRFYLDHTRWINNWDLIDLSAPYILGSYLVERNDRRILYELSASTSIWEQRIAVVSTMMLIRNNQFKDTLQLAEKMLITKHDLIQKAIGWMLREVGKRDQRPLMDFLEKNKNIMPRTMLRYAIEKFSPEQRAYYMKARRK